MTSADPLEREVLYEMPDGSMRTEWRKPNPDTEQLKVRILEVLDREGKASDCPERIVICGGHQR